MNVMMPAAFVVFRNDGCNEVDLETIGLEEVAKLSIVEVSLTK